MGLDQLFADYEPPIRQLFERIAAENELSADRAVTLEFTSTESSMLFRSVPSARCVRLDWRGIASLWAMSQAASRLIPAMFNARRKGAEIVPIREGSPEELGHHLIGYAKQMCVPKKWRWNTYFPKPDPNTTWEESRIGDRFFFQSLGWILRHEVAHIALGHEDSPWNTGQSRAEERDADGHATRSILRDYAVDPDRPAGAKPSENELELERRAVAVGMGLIWVALYEETGGKTSDMYPPIADRLSRSLAEFGVAKDSFAAEVLSDFIKSWIDPQGVWPIPAHEKATAQRALDEACRRLDEYITAQHQQSKI